MDNRYFLVSQSGESTEVANDTLVGRGSDCDLILDSSKVSRRHAQLIVSDKGISIEDLKSSNGTSVQGEPLDGVRALQHGDELCFGPCTFNVVVQGESETIVSAPADETVVSPPAAAEVPEPAVTKPNEDGIQGSIEVMPRNTNLPPAWVDDNPGHTVFLSAEEVENMASGQAEDELAKWEARIEGPTLLILSGEDAGQPYKLQISGELSFWTIGKGGASHDLSIIIDHPSVSDYHAKLVHKEGKWKIIDQMSTNHTFVNEEQYNSAYLSPKDTIRFGGVSAMFLMPQVGEPAVSDVGSKPGFFSRLKKLFFRS